MKWPCATNLLLIALTSAAPLQTPPLLQANFDNLQPGTRLQNTLYNSMTFSGLIIKDKGPRAIFPDTEPNYALQYYDPARRSPLLSIADTGAASFDFNGFAAGCLWDTAKSGASARNLTTPPPLPPSTGTADGLTPDSGSSNNGTGSLEVPHYPGVECAFELTCRKTSGVVARQAATWRPGGSWSSSIMARYMGYGTSYRGMSFCNIQVTEAAVDVEEVILVLDSIQYRVNPEQAAAGRPAIDVT